MNTTWQLILTKNHLNLNEYGLVLKNSNSSSIMRCWFGLIAKKLWANAIKHSDHINTGSKNSCHINCDKNFAQHLLIEASFLQQLCAQQFNIHKDLASNGMTINCVAAEILLFIRMTQQHPSREIITQIMDLTLRGNHDYEHPLNLLQEMRLIQKICYQDQSYYDKNPYPHCHVYDPENQTIYDYNNNLNLNKYRLIPNLTNPIM